MFFKQNKTPALQIKEANSVHSSREKGSTMKSKTRRKWKKPKDKPKRPLSAYNIFFRHERAKLMIKVEQSQDRFEKVGFAALAKHIAAKWKQLDNYSRKPYEAQAEIEQRQYRVLLEEWKRKQNRGYDSSNSQLVVSSRSLPDPSNKKQGLSRVPSSIPELDDKRSVNLSNSNTTFSNTQSVVMPLPHLDQVKRVKVFSSQPVPSSQEFAVVSPQNRILMSNNVFTNATQSNIAVERPETRPDNFARKFDTAPYPKKKDLFSHPFPGKDIHMKFPMIMPNSLSQINHADISKQKQYQTSCSCDFQKSYSHTCKEQSICEQVDSIEACSHVFLNPSKEIFVSQSPTSTDQEEIFVRNLSSPCLIEEAEINDIYEFLKTT